MNNVTWNIWGFNNPRKQVVVANLIRDSNISICGLVDTKIKVDKMQATTDRMGRNWNYMHNGVVNKPSRIIVSWDPNRWNTTTI